MSKNRKALEWLLSEFVGISSRAILATCLSVKIDRDYFDWPHDSMDFYRCLNLLETIPEIKRTFRKRMPLKSPQWKALVESWDRLEELYDSGDTDAVNDLIEMLTKEAGV